MAKTVVKKSDASKLKFIKGDMTGAHSIGGKPMTQEQKEQVHTPVEDDSLSWKVKIMMAFLCIVGIPVLTLITMTGVYWLVEWGKWLYNSFYALSIL